MEHVSVSRSFVPVPEFTLGIRALYPDSCLYLVPMSHKNPRTEEQHNHSNTMEPPTDPFVMPGSIRLTLQRMFKI
jgi:hypothetical protein